MSHDKGTAPHPWHWKPPVWGDAGTRPGTSNPSQPRVFSRVTGKRHQRLDSSSWTGNVELRFSLKTPAQAEPWVPQHCKGGGCSITTTLGTRVKGGLSDFLRNKDQKPPASTLCPHSQSWEVWHFHLHLLFSALLPPSAWKRLLFLSLLFFPHFRWLWALHNISRLEKESRDLLPLRWERWVCWGCRESLRWRDFSRSLVRNKSSVSGVPGKGRVLGSCRRSQKDACGVTVGTAGREWQCPSLERGQPPSGSSGVGWPVPASPLPHYHQLHPFRSPPLPPPALSI